MHQDLQEAFPDVLFQLELTLVLLYLCILNIEWIIAHITLYYNLFV